MKKIEIDDNNIKMYQEYLDIQNNVYTGKANTLWMLLAMALVVLPPLCAIPYTLLFHQILLAFSVTPGVLTTLTAIGIYFIQDIVITIVWGEKIVDIALNKKPKRIRMKKFLKKYPNFDKEFSKDDVMEALKTYNNKEKNKDSKEEKTTKNIYDNDIYSKMKYMDYQELETKEKQKIKSKVYPRY